ncbi:hypothetical protein G7068_12150 [Leucobacter viscericola]|uniref:SipW-cognate class signal peptide n=1 Tax=Leucobacter viscericola TaxID=2714935 RepID=A0A6G7XHL9_9MICO|nr:hypothetical protein [Leucobacter viscericola]QIK63861.1 hypothetical protein G7068_12150 [Leucobacter viscericola]
MKAKQAEPTGIRARTKALLLSSLAVVGALVLGLGAAGGTLAMLSSSQTVPGATITAGSLGLTVNDQASVALAPYSVLPGSPQAQAFKVTNTGTVPAELNTKIAVTSSALIKDSMRARVTAVPDAASCAPGLAGTQDKLHGHTASAVALVDGGGSAVLCLELALDDTASQSSQVQTALFTLTVNGTQKDL